MPERLDGSRLLGALGAVILLVSLFLSWFKPELTAWTVFEFVDLLLAGLAVATLLAVFAQAVPSAGLKVPSWMASPWIGLLALLLVVETLINHPPAAVGRDLDTGLWIGLGGAVLMALGSLLGFGRVSLVITRRERRYRRPPPTGPVDQEEHPPTESLGYEERPGSFPETDVLDEDER